MKIAYYVIGLLFLLNPNYGIIDVLPDVIGYILILKAIERVADLFEYVADAKKILLRLAIISITKLGATVLCNVTDATFVLVLTFVFVIVELIYAIPAFIKLYNGIGYSAMRLGVPGISERTPAIRNLTVAFFICRGVLALTPELSSLLYSINRLLANSEYPATLKRNLSYICMPLLLVLAVIVLIRTIKYLKYCQSHNFGMMVDRSYEIQYSGRYGLFAARRIELGFSCLLIASLFSLDFHFDRMDIIPDAAGALFLAFTVFLLSKKKVDRIIGAVCSFGYAFISVWNILACQKFNEEYSLSDVFYTAATTEKYIQLEIYAVLEALLGFGSLLLASLLLYREIRKAVRTYCHQLYAVKPEECARDYAFEVRRSLIGCLIVGALHYTSKIIYCFLLPYSNLVSVLSAITIVFLMVRLLSISSLARQGLCDRIRDL